MNAGPAAFPDRETIADKLSALGETERSFLRLLMENSQQDENLIEGLSVHLDRAATARFLNSLKLESLGEWIGREAPARLQARRRHDPASMRPTMPSAAASPAPAAWRTPIQRCDARELG